jgi:hypothetical protein
MWTTLQPEIMSRLPHHSANGSARNGVGVVVSESQGDFAWDRQILELNSFSERDDDWDGQGAEAPSDELVNSAVRLAERLRENGVDAPTCVVPGVNGTVVLEWQEPDGAYFEIEVIAPGKAEAILIRPGMPTQSWVLS